MLANFGRLKIVSRDQNVSEKNTNLGYDLLGFVIRRVLIQGDVMYQKTLASAATSLKAIRASGVLIQVDPKEFLSILEKLEAPLIVKARNKFFLSITYHYLFIYKGFAIFTESKQPLQLSENFDLIEAENIWTPA